MADCNLAELVLDDLGAESLFEGSSLTDNASPVPNGHITEPTTASTVASNPESPPRLRSRLGKRYGSARKADVARSRRPRFPPRSPATANQRTGVPRRRHYGATSRCPLHIASPSHTAPRGGELPMPTDDPTPASRLALARALTGVLAKSTPDNVCGLFANARAGLAEPVPNGGFRGPEDSLWAPTLTFGEGPFVPDLRRVTWETLLQHGYELYRMFEVRSHAAEAARALRDAALRNEMLVEALASADECLTWAKLLAAKHLPLRCQDPILATAGTVLQNLRLKLNPFLRCYLSTSVRRDPAWFFAFPSRRDARCLVTYMLIMLAKIAGAVQSGEETVPESSVRIEKTPFQEYVPGACLAGTLQALGEHQQTCADPTCRRICCCTLISEYQHGKYFYCNEIF